MSAPSAQHQLRQHIYGDVQGYVAIFSGKRGRNEKLNTTRTVYLRWPEDAAKITRTVQQEGSGVREVYQCAHLLTGKRRVKENAAQVIACYVDGDGAQPGTGVPDPTATVESSPGRQQFYWRLTTAIDPVRAEQINRRLAAAMRADMSGWDLTQVLRPPGTYNRKYPNNPEVQLIEIRDHAYDPDELERILPELPAETTVRAEVKLERSAAAAPIGDRDQRAYDRMVAGKRGSELQHLLNGGSVHNKPEGGPDHSADDLSAMSGLAYWYDRDPSRMAAQFLRGRDRQKLHEVHSSNGETYLEMTIGKAISGCSQTFRDFTGYDAGDAPEQRPITQPPKPVKIGTDGASTCLTEDPATLEDALQLIAQLRQENAEYRESNRDTLAWVERLAGFNEELQACNATLSSKLTAKSTEVERLNREMYADRRLGRCKNLTSSQRDTIRAVVRVASSRADHFDNDAPIITAETLGKEIGKHESTARAAAETVCSLPGSPITKAWAPGGKYGKITTYELAVRDPVELLEQFVVVAENLEEKRSSRPQPPKCKDHPNAATLAFTRHVCSKCRQVVASTFPGESGLSEQNARIGVIPPRVSTRNTVVQNPRIGTAPEPAAAPFVQVARVAPDEPVSLDQIREERRTSEDAQPLLGPPPRCTAPGCRALEFKPQADGSWRCGKSGHDPSVYQLAAVAGGSE